MKVSLLIACLTLSWGLLAPPASGGTSRAGFEKWPAPAALPEADRGPAATPAGDGVQNLVRDAPSSTVVSTEDLDNGPERVGLRSNARFSDHTRQFFRLPATPQ
jgi:hypothetical protein